MNMNINNMKYLFSMFYQIFSFDILDEDFRRNIIFCQKYIN